MGAKITYLSYKKGVPKNFAPNIPLYFGKVFEIPKNFLQKVLWSGFGAEATTFNTTNRTAYAARLFFFPKCKKSVCMRIFQKFGKNLYMMLFIENYSV